MVAANSNFHNLMDIQIFSIEDIRRMMEETKMDEETIDLSLTAIKLSAMVNGYCDIYFIRDGDKYVSFNLIKELAIYVATMLGTLKERPMILDIIRVQ